MSIELKQALEALIEARRYVVGAYECAFPDQDLNESVIRQIDEAVTAIQQAESEPVGEPRARVELMKTGGNAGLSTRIIELDIATRERLRPGDLLYTHPDPGVPDDVVRDADRLDWLARNPVDALDVFGKSRPDEARFIRATIDAAMLAASKAQKGGE